MGGAREERGVECMGSDPELLQPCPEGHTGPPEGPGCVQMLGVFSTFSLSDRTANRLLLFWVNE